MMDSILAATLAGATALTGVAAFGTFVPQSQFWGRIICSGAPARPAAVALTFDDGPTPGPTDRVLEILEAAGVKAAFFVIGVNCRRSPDLLRRIHHAGHLIGNHTYDHSHHGVYGMQRYWDEQLRRTDEVIGDTIGVRPAMFRPPMGIKTFHTMRAAHKLDQRVIGWTRKARDGVATTADAILARLQDKASGGDILLLHDGIEPSSSRRDPRPTLDALPQLIRRLQERGFTMPRLDAFLDLPGYHPWAGPPPEAAEAAHRQ